jgi:biotin carboxyl carrier protein
MGEAMHYRFEAGGKVYEVVLERHGNGYRAEVDGQLFELEVLDVQPGQISLRFGEQPRTVYWAADGNQKWVSSQGCAYRLGKPSPGRGRSAGQTAGESSLRAPMPAQVRQIQVSNGDLVETGQTLLLLEAMKMEIRLQAPRRGRIARLLVQAGQTVAREQVLVEMERDT